MTVIPPDFDKEMHGHSAVKIEGACHAMVSDYSTGEQRDATECGILLSSHQSNLDLGSRIDFQEENVPMCSDCWPAEVIGEE